MDFPLVSIVIPTWQRPELLEETLNHIKGQAYRPLQIIVVVDGPDYTSYGIAREFSFKELRTNFMFNINILGRNWSGLDKSSFGIAPLLVGYLLAKGTYVMPWCDDERALADYHIEKLVQLIETPLGVDECDTHGRLVFPDFVYPRVHIWRNGAPSNHERRNIGMSPPAHGQITHFLFRPENLVKFGYPDWGSHPVDWSLIEKWMRNGAQWAMLDEVTFEHRLDQ
jgi:glycosyltransferase involved in cell wall biosynthesis